MEAIEPSALDRYVIVWAEVTGDLVLGLRHVEVVEAADRSHAIDRFVASHRERVRVVSCEREYECLHDASGVRDQARTVISAVREMRDEMRDEMREMRGELDGRTVRLSRRSVAIFILCFVSAFVVSFLVTSALLG